MNQYGIHETVIKDIIDVVADVKKSDEIDMFFSRDSRKYFKSISNASSNLTLVFPVIASTNLSIDNISIISKAIERKAVTMLQILFSAICVTDAKDAFDQISRVHTNLKLKDGMSVDDFMDTMDKFVDEGTIRIDNREVYDAIREDMKHISYVPPANISDTALVSYRVKNSPYRINECSVVLEAKRPNNSAQGGNASTNTNISGDIVDSPTNIGTRTTINNYSGSAGPRSNFNRKDEYEALNKQVIATDIKKANELIPSMMIVNFVKDATDGKEAVKSCFIIGVKAKIYPVDSMDIINRISIKKADNNVLLQFIRATTRETSFLKDFLFAIDRAKMDALSTSNRGSSSKLWKVLERRSRKSRMRKLFNQYNDATAISTLVVSQEEVEYMKKMNNIDIERPEIIRPIMESYNFMGCVIVDSGMEVAKFIFDTGEDIYEHIGFNLLEREAADPTYKKVVNLVSKMNKY